MVGQMTDVDRQQSTQSPFGFLPLEAKTIKSIQLADGWHNVKNCRKTFFEVTSSPAAGPGYSSLVYDNENGVEVITSLRNIISYSKSPQK